MYRKIVFTVTVLLVSLKGYAQERDTAFFRLHKCYDFISAFHAPKPKLSYMSHIQVPLLCEHIGEKYVFKQKCTNTVDSIIANGEVNLEHAKINNAKCFESLIFKDTLLICQAITVTGRRNIGIFMRCTSLKIMKEKDLSISRKKGYIRNSVVYYDVKNSTAKNKVFHQLIYTPRKLILMVYSEKLFE